MIPIFALCIPITVLMIPIVAIISGHRYKMEQLRLSTRSGHDEEVATLRREVQELKEMVHTQMLALDVFSGGRTAKQVDEQLADRMSIRQG